MTGEAELYESGEKVFEGDFSGMIERLSKELRCEPGFTKKIKASLEGLPTEKNRIYTHLNFNEDVKHFFRLEV